MTVRREALAGLVLNDDGLVQTEGDGSFATAVPGVFAAGDLVNGGTTAVRGISEGMQAAEEIDRALRAGGGPQTGGTEENEG